jgi:zinc protease
MIPKQAYCALAAAATAIILCASASPAAGAPAVLKRANGPEIVLDRREGSGAVCVMVAVNAGSSCETPDTRGATHFIEHMAFDGSDLYTREEMSGWVDDVGGFLNAFTRKETTVFFLLVPSVHLERGMGILSQMLLHSTFLPQEIEKERSVILEEMRRERDDPRASGEGTVDRLLYRGSRLTEPVIGYPASIESMSASALKAFYDTYYRSSNMRIVVTGDFDPETVERLVDASFPAGPGEAVCAEPSVPEWSGEISIDSIATGEGGFDILVPLPAVGESGFPAALLVEKMLEGDDSPLVRSIEALSLPAPETSVEIHRGFSALRIHVGAPAGGDPSARGGSSAGSPAAARDAYLKIPAAIESLADWTPTAAELERARVSYLSSEMFDREMYHFYIMLHGDAIALFGAKFLSQSDAVAGVTAGECAGTIGRTFRPLRYNACIIETQPSPAGSSREGGGPGMPGRMPGMPGMPRASGMPGAMPGASPMPAGMPAQPAPAAPSGTLSVAAAGAAPAASPRQAPRPAIETLPNGCVVAAISRPGSPVAALHLMFRGRACAENDPPTGLVEVLATLLESSAAGKILSTKLDALGARLQLGDNPYVPMDDYLLNPSYAFVRLEAPQSSIREAASLLVDHLLHSPASGDDLAAAKQSLAREVGMRSASTSFVLRETMMGALLGRHPYAFSMFPSPGPLMRVPLSDVLALRERLFTGRNAIATLVSPETPRRGCALLRELLAGMPEGTAIECPPLPESPKGDSIEKKIRKEGATIAEGWLARDENAAGTAALMIAGEVLSRRMQLELREKQGLAYSIDCGVAPLPSGAVVIAYLGTGSQRVDEAERALSREIRGLGERPPDDAEIEIAKSRLLGKRARSQLSSINEAWALGFDILLGGDRPYRSMNELIAGASSAEVRSAARENMSGQRGTVVRLLPDAHRGE